MNSLSDNTIMLKVRAGDLDKMGLLFERHHKPLFGFLINMTHDREASEDMIQVVFYKMLKYRKTFLDNGEFISWMYRITRNVLKDEWRKNKKTERNVPLEDWTESIEGGTKADGNLDRKHESQELYRAMSKLTEEHREILTLSRFQELSQREISGILNISEGAVRVRVFRAMKELKHIYSKKNLINSIT